ncbi:DUF4037 domain-containing protein [Oceanirhabdus seepicola]|uniref:DUF4037 domain-containing protein n=1 Tax=Oceanirhabdus seepicola TaxID=2828781 RepID=A0A9J6P4Q2_9CLOT|nr:DUF4037 domain-containing protein [Oceanirhabdus seepicola]MCM1991754.1 DUF4037 domain-containing protein [Oceanirhabdus seepicola]
MKGLELCESFYFDVVKILIDKNFPMLKNKYAAGLIGYGSDVLGNDDELSRDHEWGPRCHIWLMEDDYNKYAGEIDMMLKSELPLEYLGYKTRFVFNEEFEVLITTDDKHNSIHHVAITTVERYLRIQYGIVNKDNKKNEYYLNNIEWLCIPEQKLLELTRGKIFEDSIGEITKVRKTFSYYNDDVWKYKVLYCWRELDDLATVPLCFKRNQIISGKIILTRIIENTIRLVYLYNKKYYPGYMKWFSYEFSKLPKLAASISTKLEKCLNEEDITKIINIMENVFLEILEEHNRLGVTPYVEVRNNKWTRELVNISTINVCKALEETITSELKELNIDGSCDQWITNSEILVWSEQFTKVKELYINDNSHCRDGVGDRII